MIFVFTGASGFIGSCIKKYFSENNNVIIDFKNFDYSLDLKPDVFIHCASATPGNTASQLDIYDSNYNLLKGISDFIKKTKPNFIFNLSSMSVFGDSPEGVVTENSSSTNLNLYGLSKFSNELYLYNLCKILNLKYLAVRLPGVVGYGSKDIFLMKVIAKLKLNQPITIHSPENLFNNLTHTDDIINIINGFINKEINSNFINVHSTEALKLIDIINFLRTTYNSDSQIFINNDSIVKSFYIKTIYENISTKYFNSTLNNLKKIEL
jgi:nucleoside-diphosphate-sugar epimerase